MEANNNHKENSTVSQFFNKKKLKLGGEENKIPIPINNKDINNDANNPQNTKEKMQFLFPNLPPEEINNVLERAEYNIEKAIILIKELKEQKDNLNKDNVINPKKKKGIIKRNYNCMIEKEKEFLKNQIEPNVCQNTNKTNTLNNTSNNININENKGDDDISTNPNIRNNNINMNNSNNNNNNEKENNINDEKIKDINSNNNDNNVETINNNIHIDDGKRNLINRQIQYLIVKFSEMTDISQLKNLLQEIGFPVNKENKENNDESENNKLIEKLNEKVKINKEEKKFIINQYNKHNSICKLIKQKEEKIDELTSSLVNLIDAESEQKMREEEYKNELTEYIKLLYNDNSFNFPREDY